MCACASCSSGWVCGQIPFQHSCLDCRLAGGGAGSAAREGNLGKHAQGECAACPYKFREQVLKFCLQPPQAQQQSWKGEKHSSVTVTASRATLTEQQLTELPWVLLGTLRG